MPSNSGANGQTIQLLLPAVLLQACMYRKMEPAERANLLQQLVKQLDVLEGICVGPYFAGEKAHRAECSATNSKCAQVQ